jgi:alkylation response protein AidB-like acyl-CoA dehydrogenase
MDQQDRELFAAALGQAVASSKDDTLDGVLAELGWADALADDPQAAVGILFERQGATNTTSSALDQVVLQALGLEADAVVLPALGTTGTPGHQGVGTHALTSAATAVVVQGQNAFVVDPGQLDRRAVGGVDPALGLVDVRLDSFRGETTELAPGAWDTAVVAGQRALAHQLVGASRTMLEQARAHATERIQFGQPIGRFQAVRHRLAESLVAVEAAAAAVDAAWLDPSSFAAAAAKAVAGRSAKTVSRHCQQVLAGIGFTNEHDFHLYARRVLVLDQLLGSARTLTRDLGAHLIGTGQVPPLLPL